MFKPLLTITLVMMASILPAAAQKTMLPLKRTGALRMGMSLPDAIDVAIKCVREASGYKTISDKRKIKLYRPEDKLSDLGITSADRLNALRRYIVRNEEIGVQSVYDLDIPANGAYQHRRYVIQREKLLALSSSWTLLKLAQTIHSASGLPRLPFSTAAQIVTDCRLYRESKEPIQKPQEKPAEVRTSEIVEDDVEIKKDIEGFVKCIVTGKNYSVSTVSLFTPDDDEVSYFLSLKGLSENDSANSSKEKQETVTYIKERIEQDRWNFMNLISFVAQNSQVEMPVEHVASGIVISNILRMTRDKAIKFTDKSTLNNIREVTSNVDDKNTPVAQLDLQVLERAIEKDIGCQPILIPDPSDKSNEKMLAIFTQRKLGVLSDSAPGSPSQACNVSPDISISGTMTVGTLIKLVETQIRP